VRFGLSLVATRAALEDQRVLAELVAQFVDSDFTRHGANCCDPRTARPSSSYDRRTLYELAATRSCFNAVTDRPPLPFATRCQAPIN
jgi:hypothetical protein